MGLERNRLGPIRRVRNRDGHRKCADAVAILQRGPCDCTVPPEKTGFNAFETSSTTKAASPPDCAMSPTSRPYSGSRAIQRSGVATGLRGMPSHREGRLHRGQFLRAIRQWHCAAGLRRTSAGHRQCAGWCSAHPASGRRHRGKGLAVGSVWISTAASSTDPAPCAPLTARST